jgi:hypothetical protein
MNSDWRCDADGPVLPFHVAEHINGQILESAVAKVRAHHVGGVTTPVWSLWPPPPGWMVTGVGWAGDERSGVRATVLACSGPAPINRGPADVVLVAEEPGVGLGARRAGIEGTDPGAALTERMASTSPHAKLNADGHPTPLWSIPAGEGRCAYVGEAVGRWLWAVAWPAEAGYVLAEHLTLLDLRDELPQTLVFGAPSPYLRASP